MLILKRLLRSLYGKHIRNKKVDYPTAKPTEEDYDQAVEILNKYTINNIERIQEYLDIIAYLIKYKCIFSNSTEADFEAFSRCFATAPWMAQTDNDYYLEHLHCLKDLKIVNYNSEQHSLSLPQHETKYEKVKMKPIEKSFDKVYDYLCKQNREEYFTLNISTFHARSYMRFDKSGNQPLVKLLREFPNLTIHILCVGKQSSKVAVEGADRKHINNAVKPGMLSLYKMLFLYKNKLKIRIIKDSITDACLRTVILIKRNQIKYCSFDMWRIGKERALNGISYEIDPDASLAIQINNLFSEGFKRAVPARRNLEWLIYVIKRFGNFGVIIFFLFIVEFGLFKMKITDINGNDKLTIFYNVIITILGQKTIAYLKDRFFKE